MKIYFYQALIQGAIESGKITANYILDIEDYKHDAPFYIKYRYVIDEKYIKKFLRMVKMGRYDA